MDTSPQIVLDDIDQRVWRVGFAPEPWSWPGWQWAGVDGRFDGRWDDRQGNFRTIYAGTTLLACLLEVLAGFRPDPTLMSELGAIVENDQDAALHPTSAPGEVPRSWLEPRLATNASLIGTFCAVSESETIAALRPRFAGLAHMLSLHDFGITVANPASTDRVCCTIR